MDFATHLQSARGVPAGEAAALTAQLNATAWGGETQINPEPKDPFFIFTAREVLPAPNAEGIVRGDDGREYYVPNPQALAATLNAQRPRIRLDQQHWSEDDQNNFPESRKNSTEAAGWAANFQASANGAISRRQAPSSGRKRWASDPAMSVASRRCGGGRVWGAGVWRAVGMPARRRRSRQTSLGVAGVLVRHVL